VDEKEWNRPDGLPSGEWQPWDAGEMGNQILMAFMPNLLDTPVRFKRDVGGFRSG
jgi:hypothetical protein